MAPHHSRLDHVMLLNESISNASLVLYAQVSLGTHLRQVLVSAGIASRNRSSAYVARRPQIGDSGAVDTADRQAVSSLTKSAPGWMPRLSGLTAITFRLFRFYFIGIWR